MTRRFRPRLPLTVTTDAAGTPLTIGWDGRIYRVVQIAERWRVRTTWWKHAVAEERVLLRTDDDQLLLVMYTSADRRWWLDRWYD